jgi:hypothetical protein
LQLTPTFLSLLLQFRSVFTAPSFNNFQYIATGWCLSPRHRYVTEMIQSGGATRRGHHSRYHRFFSAVNSRVSIGRGMREKPRLRSLSSL